MEAAKADYAHWESSVKAISTTWLIERIGHTLSPRSDPSGGDTTKMLDCGEDSCNDVGEFRCFYLISDTVLMLSLSRCLTNASNPWGACITELGCSSSSDLGLRASEAAFAVSS